MNRPRLRILLSLLSVVPCLAESQQAENVDVEFKDWSVRCDQSEQDGARSCYLNQHVRLKSQSKALVDVAVGYFFQPHEPVAIFTLPLGVHLPSGLVVRVDDTKPMRLNIERCDGSGCQAGLVLQERFLTRLKRGNVARIVFQEASGRRVSVPVSLQGFTAAFDSLSPQ
ncbi:MAG: invasion associated locus B family protein [Gammaproteobacteria bacterium]|nr:invasion associated locus B family protein [Gammaproteobacteria bacterium]